MPRLIADSRFVCVCGQDRLAMSGINPILCTPCQIGHVTSTNLAVPGMEQQQKTLPLVLLHFANTPLGAFFVGALVLLASFTNYLGHNAYRIAADHTGHAFKIFPSCRTG